MEQYPAVVSTVAATDKDGAEDSNAPIPRWSDLAQLDKSPKDGRISLAEIDSLTVRDLTYSERELQEKLLAADNLKELRTRGDFRSITRPDIPGGDIAVTRADWIRAKLHHWAPFWFWPALAAAAIGILFWIGSVVVREPQQETTPEPAPTGKAEAPPPAPAGPPPSGPPPSGGTGQGPGEVLRAVKP